MVSRGQRKKTAGKGIAGRDPRTRSHVLKRTLEWFSQDCNFIDLALHGNVGWEPMQLIVLAVLWSWSERSTLTKAFEDAAQLAHAMFGSVAVTTYQGFTGALRSYTGQLPPTPAPLPSRERENAETDAPPRNLMLTSGQRWANRPQ